MVQVLPDLTYPLLQVKLHIPAVQDADVAPAGTGHFCPAVPQLLTSLLVLRHPEAVLVEPAGQVKPQTPLMQVAVVAPEGTGQTLPTDPQF